MYIQQATRWSKYSFKKILQVPKINCAASSWLGKKIFFMESLACALESVQDFLIKLDMKPCMHLVEISIFSLNHVIVRLTKIMNNLVEYLKIYSFEVIFLCLNLVESFRRWQDLVKKCLFPIYADVVWCPEWSKNLGRYLLASSSHL